MTDFIREILKAVGLLVFASVAFFLVSMTFIAVFVMPWFGVFEPMFAAIVVAFMFLGGWAFFDFLDNGL